MLTDKQEETFQKLNAGKLTASEKADFYYRLSGILKKDLEGLKDLSRLLDEIPKGNLKKINLMDAATTAMELTEKLIKKLNPPQVRRKHVPVVGRRNELEAVKSFNLGPFNHKYYLEDQDGKREIATFGYSFTRGLTLEEKNLILGVSWHIDDLRDLLVPRRISLEDCPLEDFLSKIIPPLIADAKKKGVSHQVTIDSFDTMWPLEELASVARQNKAEAKEEPK